MAGQPFRRGEIVWAEVDDPQGRNRKPRPVILLTSTEGLGEKDRVAVVAITTQIDQTPPLVRVSLDWDPTGRARTGLRQRCVAVCTWISMVPVENIGNRIGIVPNGQMAQIDQKLEELAEGESPPEDTPA